MAIFRNTEVDVLAARVEPSRDGSDEQIGHKARRFLMNGNLGISGLDVHVRHGELTLTGTVQTYEAKRAAEDAAQGLPGVAKVHNHIEVVPAADA